MTTTVTVIPQKTISGNLVNGTPMTFSIHIVGDSVVFGDTTLPYVNPISDKYYREGDTIPAIYFTGDADNYNYSISGNHIGFNIWADAGVSEFPSFVADIYGVSTQWATITVTPRKMINGYFVIGTPTSFTIYVEPDTTNLIHANGIFVTPNNVTMQVGGCQPALVEITPYNTDDRRYTYQVENSNIAYVYSYSYDSIYSYAWDSIVICGLSVGTTYIVVTSVDGNYSDTCRVTVLGDTTTHSVISGMVMGNDTNCIGSGFMLLYKETSSGYICVDTTYITPYGTYSFSNVEQGVYLVQAIATSIPNAIPTYFGNTDVWYLADTIIVSGNYPITGINISIITWDSLAGNAIINGYVGDENGTKSLHKTEVENPYEGATVLLKRKENTVLSTIAKTQTDENGFFEFRNLTIGNYIIVLDIPGMEMIDFHEINITDENETVESKNYIVTEEGIKTQKTTNSICQSDNNNEIILFPNPVNDYVQIQTDNMYIETISVFSISGQMVKQFDIRSDNSMISLDINELSEGVYMIMVKSENAVWMKKLIKQ